jgi:hypothetical protein
MNDAPSHRARITCHNMTRSLDTHKRVCRQTDRHRSHQLDQQRVHDCSKVSTSSKAIPANDSHLQNFRVALEVIATGCNPNLSIALQCSSKALALEGQLLFCFCQCTSCICRTFLPALSPMNNILVNIHHAKTTFLSAQRRPHAEAFRGPLCPCSQLSAHDSLSSGKLGSQAVHSLLAYHSPFAKLLDRKHQRQGRGPQEPRSACTSHCHLDVRPSSHGPCRITVLNRIRIVLLDMHHSDTWDPIPVHVRPGVHPRHYVMDQKPDGGAPSALACGHARGT